MRSVLVLGLFMLATLGWEMAQQPETSGGQATSPSSQTPSASQSQNPSAPGSASQGSAQSGADNLPITEGCLGGTSPNFTITDKAGTTYKLNFPPNADASSLASHLGESVQIMGTVMNGAGAGKASSIDVSKIGRGTGSCPASGSKQPNP